MALNYLVNITRTYGISLRIMRKKIKDFKDSDVFCPAPFTHFFIHSNETPKPCCAAEVYETWNTPGVVRGLRDEWESYHYTELRQAMFDGKKSKICKRCYDTEETGGRSDRNMMMKKYMNISPDLELDIEIGNEFGGPLDLDLRPGNLCNLQCRMCGPASSSQYNREVKKDKNLLNFIEPFNEDNQSIWSSNRNLEFLLENMDKGSKGIKFLGGEPTIMPEVDKIMDYLIEHDTTDVQLSFTSNLTNSNKKFLDKISNFKSVLLHFSMDGVDETLEYIRYPAKWYSLQKNLAKITKLPNVEQDVVLSFTLQAYNLCNLKDTLRWATQQNKSQENYKLHLQAENLTHPSHFSYKSLPKDFRDKIALDIMNSDEINQPGMNDHNNTKSQLEFILNDNEEYDMTKFADITFRLDQSRGQHVKDYIPELWTVLEPYYNESEKQFRRK